MVVKSDNVCGADSVSIDYGDHVHPVDNVCFNQILFAVVPKQLIPTIADSPKSPLFRLELKT